MGKRGLRFDPNLLEEYAVSNPIEVSRKQNRHPIQEQFFNSYSPSEIRQNIGAFYEVLTEGIFGGTWLGSSTFSDNGETFKPDVFNSQSGFIEAKAVCWIESLKLSDYQIDKYLAQQCESFFFENPTGVQQIDFAIYKYKIDSPIKELEEVKGNRLEHIIAGLSKETGFLLFLPLSIIERMHSPESNSQFHSRYQGQRWDQISKFSSKGMKKMLVSPEEVIQSYGLDPDEYNITRTRLPKGIRMNNHRIAPFPILFISDKDHLAWLSSFKQQNSERIKRIIEDNKKKKDYIIGSITTREMNLEGCSDEEEYEIPEEQELEEVPF